jgi:hypothetical protein
VPMFRGDDPRSRLQSRNAIDPRPATTLCRHPRSSGYWQPGARWCASYTVEPPRPSTSALARSWSSAGPWPTVILVDHGAFSARSNVCNVRRT